MLISKSILLLEYTVQNPGVKLIVFEITSFLYSEVFKIQNRICIPHSITRRNVVDLGKLQQLYSLFLPKYDQWIIAASGISSNMYISAFH